MVFTSGSQYHLTARVRNRILPFGPDRTARLPRDTWPTPRQSAGQLRMLRVDCLLKPWTPLSRAGNENTPLVPLAELSPSFPTTRLPVEKQGHRPPNRNVSSSHLPRSDSNPPLTLIPSSSVPQPPNMPLPTFLLPLIQYLAIATPTLYAGQQPHSPSPYLLNFPNLPVKTNPPCRNNIPILPRPHPPRQPHPQNPRQTPRPALARPLPTRPALGPTPDLPRRAL